MNPDISKTKGVLVLKSIFSDTTYVCVITYQISSFYYNSNKFYTGGEGVILPPLKISSIKNCWMKERTKTAKLKFYMKELQCLKRKTSALKTKFKTNNW